MIWFARYLHAAPQLSMLIDRVLICTVLDWKRGVFPSFYASFLFNIRLLQAALLSIIAE